MDGRAEGVTTGGMTAACGPSLKYPGRIGRARMWVPRLASRRAAQLSADEQPPAMPPPPGPPEPGGPGGRRVGVWELFGAFFVIGLTAFGMAILQSIRSVPVKRGWLSREEIDEGLALVQMYPGAMMTDLVTYVGYRTRYLGGALAAAAGFMTPSLVLVLALSWAYRRYGAVDGVPDMVIGLIAIVVGVVGAVTLDFAAEHVRGKTEAMIAVAAFAVGVAGTNVLWAVLGGLVTGAVVLRRSSEDPADLSLAVGVSRRRLAVALVPAIVVAAGTIAAVSASGTLAAVTTDMIKTGAVAFGNGTTILPVLQHDVVDVHHWLSPQSFTAGIAFGQATPGPILMTAAFIGFQVAGWPGGILVGVAIFAPSVAMTTIAAEIYPWLRRLVWIRGALCGIMAAFVGLLGSFVLSLGHQILGFPAALVLGAAALMTVRAFKWSPIVVFSVGLAAWVLYLALGGTVPR
jgi:chromate transporter